MKNKCGSCEFAKESHPIFKKWGYYCSNEVAEKAGRFINKKDEGCRQHKMKLTQYKQFN